MLNQISISYLNKYYTYIKHIQPTEGLINILDYSAPTDTMLQWLKKRDFCRLLEFFSLGAERITAAQLVVRLVGGVFTISCAKF